MNYVPASFIESRDSYLCLVSMVILYFLPILPEVTLPNLRPPRQILVTKVGSL